MTDSTSVTPFRDDAGVYPPQTCDSRESKSMTTPSPSTLELKTVVDGSPFGEVEWRGSTASPGARLPHQFSVLATRTLDGNGGTFTETLEAPFPRYIWPTITAGVSGVGTRLFFVVNRT